MRIRKIELENHPILNNLKLDFTDKDGNSIDTIILAGENGTGKTSILDLLYEFSMFKLNGEKRNEKRTFEIELSKEELEAISYFENIKYNFKDGFLDNILTFVFDFNISGTWNHIKVEFTDSKNQRKTITGNFLHEPEIRSKLRCIYSDVEINYTPKEIRSVTAKDLDQDKGTSYKSDGNLATEITQLLVDIQAVDSQEFSQWAKQNIGSKIDDSKIDKRIKRFTKAFETIFPSKQFLGIQNINNQKQVLFQEDEKIMSIDQLSSGEKQIVFRGGFLLKDKETNVGSIFLIDEPEISLHPKWQIEILNFYKNIINSGQEDDPQLFVATHSPFIIHNPNRRNDKVIILTKTGKGIISTLKKPEFYSWTNSKIVKEAFQIDFNYVNERNKLFVEGETDEKYLNKTIEIFKLQKKLSFDISWIGRINEKGNVEFTGDTALNHAKSFFVANSDIIKSKIVLYYDSDTNKPEENYNNLFIRKMPKNDLNKTFKIGIENLLTLPKDIKISDFYSDTIKTDDYGAESIIRKLNKTKLCKWICDECDESTQKQILMKLEPLLLKLNKEIK
ncbi:AAA family ATPase [Aquimarina sp. 2304DJ70-9]|uniref:AAA family ATPase n=1 Tax=Aquimarina penaris TaxID=3231044 RepID=UPI00346283B5